MASPPPIDPAKLNQQIGEKQKEPFAWGLPGLIGVLFLIAVAGGNITTATRRLRNTLSTEVSRQRRDVLKADLQQPKRKVLSREYDAATKESLALADKLNDELDRARRLLEKAKSIRPKK
jgi:hypothetical protein